MRPIGKLLRLIDLEPMVRRPPLKRRYWAYTLVAYALPVIAQVAFPDDSVLNDELIWLVTLVPAFLLSLHFGMKGALVGLISGTLLFLTVQWTLAINDTADAWRITVPIYIAYSMLVISVGWLSQQLHVYYHRALEGARLTAITEVSVTVQHEVNNALMVIMAESHRLAEQDRDLTDTQRASARAIQEAARRIAADVKKLTHLATAPSTVYVNGSRMLDLERAQEH